MFIYIFSKEAMNLRELFLFMQLCSIIVQYYFLIFKIIKITKFIKKYFVPLRIENTFLICQVFFFPYFSSFVN